MNQDKDSFYSEIIWASSALILLLFFGYLLGNTWFFFAMGLLVYILWHLRQLSRLIQWLANNEKDMPPDASGFWGDVFRHLYRIQRHNHHRQEKLMLLLNRYKESTEAMPDATIILSKNWEIEWFNSKGTEYFGLQTGKDNGQLLSNLIRSPILWDFLDSHEEDPSFKQTLEINASNSERILSIRLIPYGQKYLLIARDITSIKKLKTMRKDFVANVSHELRTPLTVISGYLETLGEYLKEEPVYASSIDLMQQQSHRMCHIIEDLLLLSKIESSEKRVLKNEFIDMNALLMMLKKEALVLSNKQQIITIEDTGPKWLKGDVNELQSAFSNLISNAIRYTPKGGEIIIRWSCNDSGMACFEVQDNGEGIAKQHVLRLTERFYRVDVGRSRKIGGTGLGLAIVKHVLAHHHSKLEIESKIGFGSTFRCKFSDNMLKSDK